MLRDRVGNEANFAVTSTACTLEGLTTTMTFQQAINVQFMMRCVTAVRICSARSRLQQVDQLVYLALSLSREAFSLTNCVFYACAHHVRLAIQKVPYSGSNSFSGECGQSFR